MDPLEHAKGLWEFPLHSQPEEWEVTRAAALVRSRSNQYKSIVAPYPSLAFTWEKELESRARADCNPLARAIARTREAKAASRTSPKDYAPPTTAAELRSRLAAGEAYFVGAQLDNADLKGAPLMGCNLRHASFRGADLSGADLTQADLSECDFSPYPGRKGDESTRFVRTRTKEAVFDAANLTNVLGLAFDECSIKEIRTTPRTDIAWIRLRDSYTTLGAVFSLLFSALYFLPLFLGVLFWEAVGRAQSKHPQLIAEIGASLTLISGVPLKECLAESCQTTQAWIAALVISPQGLNLGILTFAILAYNIFRLHLTDFMAKWGTGERRVWSPSEEQIKYAERVDFIAKAILLMVIAPTFLFSFVPVLAQTVSIPLEFWPFPAQAA